jgi:squalene synthase HpnC
VSRFPEPFARAYAACEATARAHDGTMLVMRRLLPRSMRPHVAAVVAYAYTGDRIAGERSTPAAERLTRLDAWQRRLHAAVAVDGSGRPPHAHEDLIIVALAHSIRSRDLPLAWLDELVSACGQDTTTTRYDSWADLFDYCRRAANPMGRLLLRIAGCHDAALDAASDALCTALQLTRCWQDFSRDWVIGRLYVPREVTAACRARERDLQGPFLNDAWAAAIRQCVDRTRAQFEIGRVLCDAVGGRLRHERRLTWLSGMRTLERVERVGPALLSQRPAIGTADVPVLLWRAARWPQPGRRSARG